MPFAGFEKFEYFWERNAVAFRRHGPEFGVITIATSPRTSLKIENPGQAAGEVYGRKGRDARDANIMKII